MKNLFFILLATLVMINAQPAAKEGTARASGKGVVTGKVVESNLKVPMEYVNVVLLKEKGGEMINGTITNKEGVFEIKSVPEGNYELKISFMGYKKKLINDVKLTNSNMKYDAKELTLEMESVELAEAQVIGEKSDIEFKIDKKVINVNQNIAVTGGSVIDILQNQPSIKVDASGNVTLRGSANFQVLMDGRPTVLQGTDALRQIPANIVDNIELVTNPSAKYDSEGTSGIINIITKKLAENSFNGLANATVGTKDKYGADFTFNYKTADYNLSVGLDSRRNSNQQDIALSRNTFSNTVNSYINNEAAILFRRDNYNFRFSFDYYLTDKNTLTISGTAGKNDIINTVRNDKFYRNNFTNTSLSTITNDNTDFGAQYVNGGIFIDHKFIPKVSELNLDASLTYVDLPSTQKVNDFIGANPILRERDNNGRRYNSRIRLNYTLKSSEKSKLETGAHFTLFYKDFDLRDKIQTNINNQWTQTYSSASDFTFRNNVYAAFATYEDELFGLGYQLGLRYEYTDRLLSEKFTNVDLKYSEGHFFPTFNMTRKLTEAQTLQFSYSRRIYRPHENALNPVENYSDEYTVITGNPNLKPEFTNSFELNYQNMIPDVFLSIQTYYRETKDGIEQIQKLRSDGKFALTQENITKNRSYGAEISANISPAIWLKFDPVLDLSQNEIDGLGSDFKNRSEIFNWNARLSTTLYLSQFTRIMFMINHNSKTITPTGDLEPFTIFGATIRQEFFNKALSVTLSAQNLFNTMKFKIYQDNTYFNSRMSAVPENPVFNLTISYNFNNFKRTSRAPERVDINVREGL